MKKRLVRGILAFVLIVVSVISCLLMSLVEVRERELASRAPVSLQNLNELGKRLDPSVKSQLPPQVEDVETAEAARPSVPEYLRQPPWKN